MLSPAIITLPWHSDAAERYFMPISAAPWAMLLHSGFADHPHNRFDIIVAGAARNPDDPRRYHHGERRPNVDDFG